MTPSFTPAQGELVGAVDRLVDVCHGASAGAGWWTSPADLDVAELVRGAHQEPSPTLRFLANAVIAQKIALVHSELSEALEGARKNKADDHLPHRLSIEVELADALIRIFDLAGALQLDLGPALVEKMKYNAQRADHKLEARAAAGGKAY
jgi:NTP pyrophosphatase (non-canonical NTP hydrolase)